MPFQAQQSNLEGYNWTPILAPCPSKGWRSCLHYTPHQLCFGMVLRIVLKKESSWSWFSSGKHILGKNILPCLLLLNHGKNPYENFLWIPKGTILCYGFNLSSTIFKQTFRFPKSIDSFDMASVFWGWFHIHFPFNCFVDSDATACRPSTLGLCLFLMIISCIYI